MIKPQKAKHLYDALSLKTPKTIGVKYAIFEKYDGWWGSSSGMVGILSRAGRRIPSVEHLHEILEHKLNGTLLFEIMVEGSPDFATTNGILNRSKGDCKAENAYLMVHDYISHDSPKKPFSERYADAERIVNRLASDRVRLAPIALYGDSGDVQAYAESVWERDGEGAIGKAVDYPYSFGKRDHTLLKVKEDVTLDLLVVGMEEGQGKYEGTLGKLLVRGKNGIVHSVSGMTDEERYQWWKNPDFIKGEIVEVKAMKILKDGSLREGRFKAVRFDKNVNEID